ncbi:uroporphyrinogen-III synthase [uncultured Alteromonas sp.]|jgi:uroporphyrinogen-III synthase|uniref:uroporphyrinogen-III synthase n=1 Tax=uncultured Alteromonas sp. TaxID=179113 RepID=UPI0025E51F0F|nr:uroporphyrinogen-III synthase [uncultured Alteromonas sp.]
MYLITRPLAKLATTDSAFAGAGLSASVIALQRTIELAEGIPRLQALLAAHPDAIVVVTSTAAAIPLAEHLATHPINQPVIAVGQSTAGILTHAGLTPIVPTAENSEGVLALPLLNDCANRHILLLKGKGGRTTIPEQLTLRGARLNEVVLYERVPLIPPVFSRTCNWTQLAGIIATSSEQAQALIKQFNTQPLTGVKWLTVSERIAQQLHQYGIRQADVCPKASDEALITWIQQNWE